MHWLSLVGWMGLCGAVAGLGSRWTVKEVKGWYRALRRPPIAPPNWLFGPVWTILYSMMAVAAWLVWESPQSSARSLGLALFMTQLALNLAWPWLFFRKHMLGLAAIEIFILWITIALTLWLFASLSSLASWLLVPYVAWVAFAAALNFAFWRLNARPTKPS
jgi:benzodiazapine receptor